MRRREFITRMRERLMIAVSFDPARGYVTAGGELPVLAALSLSGLLRGQHAPTSTNGIHRDTAGDYRIS
jgi:hypothetical protein